MRQQRGIFLRLRGDGLHPGLGHAGALRRQIDRRFPRDDAARDFAADAFDRRETVLRRAQDGLRFAEHLEQPAQPDRPHLGDHVDGQTGFGVGHGRDFDRRGSDGPTKVFDLLAKVVPGNLTR